MSKISFDYSPINVEISEKYGHLNFLYQYLEPSDYQYEMLDNNNLDKIRPEEHFICLNVTHKTRYFLVFNNFKGVNQAIFIMYGRHCSSSQVWLQHFQIKEDLFQGTILDGDLIQNNLGNLVFLISDMYLCKGEDVKSMDLEKKRQLINLDSDIIYNPYLTKLKFEWNPIFSCNKISEALKTEQNFDFNGIMFLPKISGGRWIFRITNEEPLKIKQKPKHKKGDQLIFTIEQTDLPDVYPINIKDIDYGHLYIPTKALSLKVRNWTQKNPTKLLCYFNGKKWIPKSLSKK